MTGFDELQPSQWVVEGIFTRLGTGRGVVKAVSGTVVKALSGTALAVAVLAGQSGAFAAMDRVQRPGYAVKAALDERDQVDPSSWAPLMARIKAAPVLEESDIDEPPMTI